MARSIKLVTQWPNLDVTTRIFIQKQHRVLSPRLGEGGGVAPSGAVGQTQTSTRTGGMIGTV